MGNYPLPSEFDLRAPEPVSCGARTRPNGRLQSGVAGRADNG